MGISQSFSFPSFASSSSSTTVAPGDRNEEQQQQPHNQLAVNENVLRQISDEGLYFGPYFLLATDSEHLLPFAQLSHNEAFSNQAGLIDNFLQTLLEDSSGSATTSTTTTTSHHLTHQQQPSILSVPVLDSQFNLVSDSIRIQLTQLPIDSPSGVDDTCWDISAQMISHVDCIVRLISSTSFSSRRNSSIGKPLRELKLKGSKTSQQVEMNQLLQRDFLPGTDGRFILQLQIETDPSSLPKQDSSPSSTKEHAEKSIDRLVLVFSVCLKARISGEENESPSVLLISKQYHTQGSIYSLHEVYGYSSQHQSPPADNTSETTANLLIPPPTDCSANNNTGNNNDCVICLCEQKTCMALPCRHMSLCRGCADIVRQQPHSKCPICRHPFYALLQVYQGDDDETMD